MTGIAKGAQPRSPVDLPVIATVIGDPGGIGPEVCVKALALKDTPFAARHILIGSVDALRIAAATSGLEVSFRQVGSPAEAGTDRAEIAIFDPETLPRAAWAIGKPGAASGRAVIEWIRLAEQWADEGRIDGWIMAPIDSDSLKLSGKIASIDDLQPAGTHLLRVSPRLRVVPITEHISIAEVPASVTIDSVSALIALIDDSFRKWGMTGARIGVAGLNPHAMGSEDRDTIAPAVERERAMGRRVEGPIPPDSIFRLAMDGRYDVVVSMYHDQGQIALKTAAFEGACTIYIGLDHVHLTVPHGSAMEIAGKGIAQHASMASAMKMAEALCAGKGFGYVA
ncbi:PdxA family dehydrogenase [Sphingobium fuliginis]|uniref:PdxA family dehydrogenase n=1 Tax=Sphingobium fuliginis (strain ATCC 27551) TaxID=336203 RepID=UPI00041A002B|nr:4-hydroxythreonine-4-phosphate dehydrogenase PdxA [Sphingobium fuliginis]